ncbi:MAG: endonuclease V [Bacteroidota bacterium]
MILATDVYYFDNKAKAVSVVFENWAAAKPVTTASVLLENVADYVPGEFYKRELPCILKVLEKTSLATLDCIIVDGFVYLDDAGKRGLGAYLYDALDQSIPIIGVAKSSFHQNEKNVKIVLRGESKKPLYVTAAGCDLAKAAENIKAMHGAYRFPTLLSLLDQETKRGS